MSGIPREIIKDMKNAGSPPAFFFQRIPLEAPQRAPVGFNMEYSPV